MEGESRVFADLVGRVLQLDEASGRVRVDDLDVPRRDRRDREFRAGGRPRQRAARRAAGQRGGDDAATLAGAGQRRLARRGARGRDVQAADRRTRTGQYRLSAQRGRQTDTPSTVPPSPLSLPSSLPSFPPPTHRYSSPSISFL